MFYNLHARLADANCLLELEIKFFSAVFPTPSPYNNNNNNTTFV